MAWTEERGSYFNRARTGERESYFGKARAGEGKICFKQSKKQGTERYPAFTAFMPFFIRTYILEAIV